ncbi:MAG TPA: GDSL-type esterase/lipase family protein [Ktedonobacteraceae bacterium]|nr:GDSL-type esterase/lipase family protein [Ktedonobacteraceae bacterium]
MNVQTRLDSKQSAWQVTKRLAGVFCFVLFFLASCSTSSTGQSSTNTQPFVVQQAPKARLTYVAIGASDTFGIGADDPQSENWPTDLAANLGSGVRLINLGIPGITLHQALSIEVPIAIDSHPNLITVWLAVNDLIDSVHISSYTHDLDLLLTRLQAGAPGASIVVANIPDLTLLPYFGSSDPQVLTAQIQQYNTAIATLVKRHHVIEVDLYQQWSELRNHPEYISEDGLHPSTLGYMRIADLFYRIIK